MNNAQNNAAMTAQELNNILGEARRALSQYLDEQGGQIASDMFKVYEDAERVIIQARRAARGDV